ncbi:MAG: class I SAM-dependent methyltransferase [Oscillospiraceae bacterium]|jgi:23S rRNA (cytosine1962-C5)-methyltransferase|nr:class I SAM-dependent methyltransferase [Oscillospiraceae bacterium]
MRTAANWLDYELLDADAGERLERWGDYTLIRPDPQIVWTSRRRGADWGKTDAVYIRSRSGGGAWEYRSKLPESWNVSYKGLTFKIKPTGFKHTGLFPEQAVNWDLCADLISGAGREISLLNLFAYTGGATLACLEAGASVCHIDAVKPMVGWAKENAALSGLSGKPVRWITDDAVKFLNREIRRGNRYDAVILDPPSYGRGTGGEMWKFGDSIDSLMRKCAEVLSEKPLFVMMNGYAAGLSAGAAAYLLNAAFGSGFKVAVEADEIGLPVKSSGLTLPCGCTAVARFL